MAERRRFMGPALPKLEVRAGISPVDSVILYNGAPLEYVKSLSLHMDADGMNTVTLEMYCEVDVSCEFTRILQSEPRPRWRRNADGDLEPIPEPE